MWSLTRSLIQGSLTLSTAFGATNSCTLTTMTALSNKLALGAGCYWGTEKFIVKDFQQRFPDSIKEASVGFMSPDPNAMENPSYRQVCTGQTGHVEVLDITLNEPEKHFEELIKFFYGFHDASTKNRQGNDQGTQYSSVIFCSDDKQKEIAAKVTAELQKLVEAKKVKYTGDKVITDIVDYTKYYPGPEDHQDYLTVNPYGYCNHFYRFKEWPAN